MFSVFQTAEEKKYKINRLQLRSIIIIDRMK